jgi:hypothetical protein
VARSDATAEPLAKPESRQSSSDEHEKEVTEAIPLGRPMLCHDTPPFVVVRRPS